MATINLTRAVARDLRAADPARRGGLRRKLRRNATAYLFLAGAVLCFAVFSWYPMIREVIMSFQYTNFAGDTKWVGLRNYQRVLHDPDFWSAWRTTGLFTLFALVVGYAVPFALAVVLNEIRHARSYFRLLVYLPVMMPPVAAAFLWKWFYTPDDSGLFNAALHAVGLPSVQWLQSSHTLAVLCLVLFSTWINMGGTVLVYLASLQGIPGELYEAAELDGAGLLRRVWHVTVPQTRLILSMMLLLQIVGTMQVFLEPYIITGSANDTTSVVYLIYQYAFNYDNYGSAAALGVLLLLVLIAFAGGYLWLSRRAEEE
ncbi:carbohydrate ABC transporter permease [Streptacidiphilus jiangxiensis]|uniref:Multiple sugar transport system permease protein n=1 Tax=Streptacidiphilus jiangxiensis TaxID=235985 RepID=A0A1H7P727_STRJI|nr:sugar ABC transporter permease [Streptacidiphilus jiangxiensis]SEL31553.1 multiple sugar transport system permease protein [Streptacidiphilus jiangxiensis]